MTERVTIPSEAGSCNWASDESTYSSSDPGAGKRLTGFKPKDEPSPGPGETIPASDHNWLWKIGMYMLSWLRDTIQREFSVIEEGITDITAISRLFWVYPPTTGMDARGAAIFTNVTGSATGGGAVKDLCTDGEQIYYINGASSHYLVAARNSDGSEIWENDPYSKGFSALCTDGGYLYGITTDSGTAGLRRLSRSDGTHSSSAGTRYGCTEVRANGQFAAAVAPTGNLGDVVVWSSIQATMAEDGVYATGSAQLKDIAIDNENCYVIGTRNVQDVWAVKLSNRTLAWSTQIQTASPAVARCVATDGNAVYVGIERDTIGGVNANVVVLDRCNGQQIYTLDVYVSTTPDIARIAVDDEYLYCQDSNGVLTVLKLDVAVPYEVLRISDTFRPVVDGVSVISRENISSTEFQRHNMLNASKLFMRCASDDENRRPFHTLAVPVTRI